MNRIITIFAFISLFFCSQISLATTGPLVVSVSNPPVPDISNWNIVSTSRIELRVSDCASVYIGLEVEYKNPTNERDFVRVVSRHIPVPISKCRSYNKQLFSETVLTLYDQKEEEDLFSERSKQIDPFLYIQWQIAENPQTGGDMLAGDVSIWFMPADGNWIITKNEKAVVEFMTANVGNGKPHNIFSGIECRIGDAYHIMRVNRDDIIQLLAKEGDNEN
ncbi:MAG: hypothetical protein Q8Q89_01290 [bacterium]|nr:hypothetical protein [bacterium]